MISGQGTMGLEIIDQVKDLDAIVIPVGGGGLLAGVALATKTVYPSIQIIVSLSVISNTRGSVSSGCPNAEKRVENTTHSGVFLTKFEVFG